MSNDLIRRSDAIRAVSKVDDYGDGIGFEVRSHCLVELELVPSADRPSAVDLSSVYSTAYKSGYEKGKADRPQGEWTQSVFRSDIYRYECSNCKAHHRARYDFCPSCGARMKGADDDI